MEPSRHAGRLREEGTHDVKKHRRGETQGVEPVHHAAVTLDELCVIFHPAVALDCRRLLPVRITDCQSRRLPSQTRAKEP
jgi:hypothetical protein